MLHKCADLLLANSGMVNSQSTKDAKDWMAGGIILALITIIIVDIIYVVIVAAVILWLWNYVIPKSWNAPKINFWIALAFAIVILVIFKK